MRNLIPKFIQENYKKDIFEGNFDAFTMFVDISGFTKMTEALMQQGEEGAEILSRILNQVFTPVVDAIYAKEGFISNFAGDAFTAIFPKEITQDPFHLFFSAQKIQAIFAESGLQRTKIGNFQLHVKVGLSFGKVDWGIVGHQSKTYFFRGEGIDGCAHSEHQAEKGDIIFDKKILSEVSPKNITFDELPNGYFRLLDIKQKPQNVISIKRIKRPHLSKEIAAVFLPQNVVEYHQTGEFRNVVPIFISFEAASRETFNEFVSILMKNANNFSGYFNKLDSGDKGNVAIIVLGAPKTFEDNIRRALNFILAVKKDLLDFENKASLKFRAGMTYGRVYAGIVGGEKRCEYTVLGDIVNLAARFMMKADWGECWVSERIQRQTEDAYQYENLGRFAFKGKTGKIPAYGLSGKRNGIAKTFRGKFVGRSKELQLAGDKFDLLKEKKMAGMIYIYGNAGVGKSRFVYELQEEHNDFNWLHLPCDSVLKKSFNPFTHFFSNYFQQSPESSRKENKENFDRIYEQLITDLPGVQNLEGLKSELIRLKSIMEGFLGIHDIAENSLYNQLNPKLRYENTLYAFKEIFRALSHLNPIVIELEDLHWIDEDSVDAFNVLLRNPEFPMLIVVSSRYNDDHTKPVLPVEVDALEIDLQTLSEEGTIELAESILDGKMSENLKDNLWEKTVGNPFFLEQTVYYFKESGIINDDPKNQVWELTASKTVIPATINDLLIARVDRLSNKLKEAVQTASVFGHEFELNLLLEVLRQIATTWKEKDFEELIQKGEENKVWSILSEIKAIFAHAMMRDAVYNMQLKARLRNLHKLIAETLRTFFPEDKSIYEDLAYHYERAEIKDKTMEFLLKAGDFAKDNFQNKKALELYDKLDGYYREELGIEDGDFSKVEVDNVNRELIGEYVDLLFYKIYFLDLLGYTFDIKKKTFDYSLQLSSKLKDQNRVGKAHLDFGDVLISNGNYEQALKHTKIALNFFETASEHLMSVTVFSNIGKIYWLKGDLEKALECFNKELEISEMIKNEKEIGKALSNIAIIYDFKGDFSQSQKFYEKALRLSKKADDKIQTAMILGNIGVMYYYQQDLDKAMEYYEQKLNLCNELGNKKEVATALGNIAMVYTEEKNYEKAMIYNQKKIQLCQELDDKEELANVIGEIGNIHKAQKDYEQATKYYDEAIEISTNLGVKYLLAAYLIEKAELMLLRGKSGEGKRLNTKGLTIAKELNFAEYINKGKELSEKLNLKS